MYKLKYLLGRQGHEKAGGMDLTLVVKECFTEEEAHWVLKDEWEAKSGEGTAGKGNCQGQRPEMSSAGLQCCFDSAIIQESA